MAKSRSPLLFAVGVLAIYLAAIVPVLLRHGFDTSTFIVAGDHYVDATQLPSPIDVRPNSDGYDGQFYYRLALAPFDLRQPLDGIKIDAPVYRMQRMVYPVLAWAASLGEPRLVPLALLLINLAGLAAIALLAARLTRCLELPALVPFAIVLWPGFVVTLTHDTTEILSTAFLMAALDRYFAGRLVVFVALGAIATLTRETTALVLGGLFIYELLLQRNWARIVLCAVALVPVVIWRQTLATIWGATPSSAAIDVLTWPMLGIVDAFRSILFGDYVAATGIKGAILRAYAFVSIAFLVGFSALTVSRFASARKVLVAGWLPSVALMAVLGANGPWIEPIGFFRAFTECWVVGCLLFDARFAHSRLALPALATLLLIWIGAAWQTTSAIN